MKIGFWGERGAYAEAAASALFSFDIATRPFKSWTAVFDAIDKGEISLGVVPLETNRVGTLPEVLDLLRAREVYIQYSMEYPTDFALAAVRGATEAGIRRIYAPPTSMALCSNYLRNLEGVDLVPRFDSEKSNLELVRRADPSEGTLCGPYAALMYGLSVVRPRCNDDVQALTRYIGVAKEPRDPAPAEGPAQTMAMFELKHEPGALARTLEAFSSAGINLTGLAMRRTPAGDDYTSYVTFNELNSDPKCAAAFKKLKSATTFLRSLGSYALRSAIK